MKKHFFLTASAVSLGLALVAAQPASAKDGVNVGVLSCEVAPGVGLIIGSSKSMSCVFDPAGGKAKQRYRGSINKIGLDIGVTNKSYIKWVVFAPGEVQKGALAGDYGGVSAEATVVAGVGANALVGGLKKSITLQPVSVQGQTGLNLAAGVAGMKLKYVK